MMVHLHYYGHLSVRVLAIMGLGQMLILAFEASFIVVPHTVRVIKKVTITENRQRTVNDYRITVNG